MEVFLNNFRFSKLQLFSAFQFANIYLVYLKFIHGSSIYILGI